MWTLWPELSICIPCSTVYFLSFYPPSRSSVITLSNCTNSPCSVYTPLSPCHHSYISCQVELASFSTSCCSPAKNKTPLCRAATRLHSGPPQGLNFTFWQTKFSLTREPSCLIVAMLQKQNKKSYAKTENKKHIF